jgi:Rrf2 family protein
MRMSAKAEYAVRAMTQLASAPVGVLVKTDELAKSQGIPAQFLVDILSDLRADRLARSHRGRDGGYELARPAAEISIADVLRCIDGPLASVRDIGLGDLPYVGPTAALTDVWRALRASMRSVLEETTLADVALGALGAYGRIYCHTMAMLWQQWQHLLAPPTRHSFPTSFQNLF